MVVSALIGAGPTVGRVGEFGAFSRLFGGNLVSVSIDLEFVVYKRIFGTCILGIVDKKGKGEGTGIYSKPKTPQIPRN